MNFSKVYSFKVIEYLIFIGFAFFSFIGILHHEMWRDEIQSWLLARDSSSITELLQNMYHEGHPALWYLALFFLSRITHNPVTMQIFHWTIALGVVFLLLKYSPFSARWKFLLTFSYFITYEYTFISRNYSLAIFFSFLFCILISQARKHYLAIFISLSLLANTSAYGFLLSLALLLFLFLEESEKGKSIHYLLRSSLNINIGLSLLFLGWLIAFYQIVRVKSDTIIEKFSGLLSFLFLNPSKSTAFLDTGRLFTKDSFLLPEIIRNFILSINSVWNSYIPIPPLFQLDFWGRNLLEEEVGTGGIESITYTSLIKLSLSLLLLFLFAVLFKAKKSVFLTYIFGNLLLIGFQTVVFKGHSLRHQGFFFILLIICTWLYWASVIPAQTDIREAEPSKGDRWLGIGLSIIFSVQMIVGIYAAAMDYVYPFSGGKAAAELIAKEGLQTLNVMGSRYRQASVISGYLDIPIYYLERKEKGSFTFDAPPEFANEAQLLQEIESTVYALPKQKHLLVLTQPLTLLQAAELKVDFLGEFSQAIEPSEEFYLYTVQRPQ